MYAAAFIALSLMTGVMIGFFIPKSSPACSSNLGVTSHVAVQPDGWAGGVHTVDLPIQSDWPNGWAGGVHTMDLPSR